MEVITQMEERLNARFEATMKSIMAYNPKAHQTMQGHLSEATKVRERNTPSPWQQTVGHAPKDTSLVVFRHQQGSRYGGVSILERG
jgi:hypothetical protein